jgi:transcriptional regulator with XRE-family HTH domain
MRDDDLGADAARLLTVRAAAQRASVSPHTIRSWITRGLLPAVVIAGQRAGCGADLRGTQALVHAGTVVAAGRDDLRRAGKRLRALREAAGLSQLQLEAASGLTHEAISRLEAGRWTPYAATVRTLAQALRVDPERFVGHDPIGLTMLTSAEVAARLEVPEDRGRKWLQAGLLARTKVSRHWWVPAVAVMELERSGRLRGGSRRLDPRYRC